MTVIYRELVPKGRRVEHTAALFGHAFPLRLEPSVFTFAERLSPDYHGGYWHLYALSNGGFYMAPEGERAFNVRCENCFVSTLSADAFGVAVCLYAYSHLSFAQDRWAEVCGEHFHRLREFMLDHGEAAAILAAID